MKSLACLSGMWLMIWCIVAGSSGCITRSSFSPSDNKIEGIVDAVTLSQEDHYISTILIEFRNGRIIKRRSKCNDSFEIKKGQFNTIFSDDRLFVTRIESSSKQ